MKIRCYNFAKDLVQKYKLKTATTKRSLRETLKKSCEEYIVGLLIKCRMSKIGIFISLGSLVCELYVAESVDLKTDFFAKKLTLKCN